MSTAPTPIAGTRVGITGSQYRQLVTRSGRPRSGRKCRLGSWAVSGRNGPGSLITDVNVWLDDDDRRECSCAPSVAWKVNQPSSAPPPTFLHFGVWRLNNAAHCDRRPCPRSPGDATPTAAVVTGTGEAIEGRPTSSRGSG